MGSWINRGLIAMSTLTLLAGCVRQDLPECITNHELYIRVASATQRADATLTITEVDSAALFVFDDSNVLQEVVAVDRNTLDNELPIDIEYRGSGRPRVVVWGNLKTAEEMNLVPGVTTLDQLQVKMRDTGRYSPVPDNLYYGTRDLTWDQKQYVVINPAMGRLTITARGIEVEDNEEYYFTVETPVEGYDFNRHCLFGDKVMRLPASRGGTYDDLSIGDAIPVFVYPSYPHQLDPIDVCLYRTVGSNAQLIGRTEIDDRQLEIIPHAGQRVNVLMNFGSSGSLEIIIRITGWDEVEQWEEW